MYRRIGLISFTGALAAGLLFGTAAEAGSITGNITYDDQVPKLRPINMDADPTCSGKHSSPVYPEILVLGDGNALANVFVQVKNAPAGEYPAPKAAAVIDQNGCLYQPHVLGVVVGQEVRFKNSDGILHNVHGRPKVNREFNIGMPPTLKEKGVTLNKPEPVFPVKCDVHPWMRSYVAVMTHPFFATTDKSGSFAIGNLPDGSYEVEAWHEKLGTRTAKVTVSGGAATVDFSFKRPAKK